MPGTATYVYCVVQRPRRPSATRLPPGVAEASTPAVDALAPRLWVVSADVPLSTYAPEQIEHRLGDLDWVSRMALAHETLVERFIRMAGASVIPMKLFTLFSSRSRAIAELRERRPQLEAIARHIRGSEEWGVRIARSSSQPGGSQPATRQVSSGTAFLAAKKQARDEVRARSIAAAEAAENALDALARLAKQTRRHEAPEGAATPPLLDAAFLVPTSRKARFTTAVKREAERCRIAGADLTLTGPWPAYNFVQFDDSRP